MQNSFELSYFLQEIFVELWLLFCLRSYFFLFQVRCRVMLDRVHTEPGNPGKVVNLKQDFSGPGIAWISVTNNPNNSYDIWDLV